MVFAADPEGLQALQAHAYMDLMFQPAPERIKALETLLPAPIFINSVIQTLSGIHPNFIRINAWPGFLEMPLLEAAAGADYEQNAREIFGKYIVFVQDVPGMVNPRIISMIINEAQHTLDAGTSSRAEIDIAMKLGTGYPMGPFEWADKIGIKNIHALLKNLGANDAVYAMASGIQTA